VGRGAELTAIAAQLEKTRLLTLTGAGGIGKTRLALRSTSEMRENFDRVAFVEMAGVQRGDLVPETVATVLAAGDQTARPALDRIIGALAQSNSLLILDNCEHLIDACARLA